MTDEERIIYTRRLLEAQEKRHAIMVGNNVEQFIDQNGETVKYSKVNIGKLDEYIAELEGLLNPSLAAQRLRRPLGFVF